MKPHLNSPNFSVGDVWSPENPGAYYPTYTNVDQINTYNYRCSSWSVENGNYLRLKNISLGYTFPAKWLEKTIFPFRWYGSRPTYEYAIGLLLLCCILFTVSLHISVAHFDLPQIYFDTVYEHCRFTFISGICAVCGYYCLIVDVSRIEKVLYIIAALFFWGFALVSFLFPFFF